MNVVGEFISNSRANPYNPKMKERAREMRKEMTTAEKKLWFGFLRNYKFKVYRQRIILHYIADFYCAKKKLVMEVDGEIHLTNEAQEYDLERTKAFEGLGIKVLRFSNDEVINEFESVCKTIDDYPL